MSSRGELTYNINLATSVCDIIIIIIEMDIKYFLGILFLGHTSEPCNELTVLN